MIDNIYASLLPKVDNFIFRRCTHLKFNLSLLGNQTKNSDDHKWYYMNLWPIKSKGVKGYIIAGDTVV